MVIHVDSEMVNAARAGDVDALNAVLACSRQDLRRYAEYHCEVNDVEDAVQETLFAASRRMRDLRKAESLVSWLFRIVKRECNRMRRGWRMMTNQEIDSRHHAGRDAGTAGTADRDQPCDGDATTSLSGDSPDAGCRWPDPP